MNTWILDTAMARLLSTNASVLTEQPNSQMVGKPYLTGLWKPVTRPEREVHFALVLLPPQTQVSEKVLTS